MVVDNGELAMIATVKQPGFSPLPGVAPDKFVVRCIQYVSGPAGEAEMRAHNIDPHAHITTPTAIAEDLHEFPPYGVVGKNIGLQPNSPLRRGKIGKHGVKQGVSVDKYPNVVISALGDEGLSFGLIVRCHRHGIGFDAKVISWCHKPMPASVPRACHHEMWLNDYFQGQT